MTVKITMERTSDSEVRITLTADIQVSGNLGPLPGAPSAASQEAGSGQAGASLQEFLTVDQTAEVLHVSRDNVYDLIRTGQLRSIKVGMSRRISRRWITQFAERQ